MLEKPVRSGFPVHPTPVHHVGGHPHAGVVVQPARCDQFVLESIHAGQVGAAIADVFWKVPLIGRRVVPGFEFLLAVMNAVTKVAHIRCQKSRQPSSLISFVPSSRLRMRLNTASRTSLRLSTPWRM